MLQTHPGAHVTPTIRAEIARFPQRTDLLAHLYDVSTETIRSPRDGSLYAKLA
jgi:hypothetical protein